MLETAAKYAPEAVDLAQQVLDDSWRIAVVGRVGVGKTTVVNRLTGTDRPVGLGGVTTRVESVEWGHGLVVDTPGIDGLDTAITILGGPLAEADAVVWIVDGLQPATRTEREALATLCLEGLERIAIVGRLDLVDPTEHEAIRDRVRQVLDADELPAGGDLRTMDLDVESVLPRETSARRDLVRRRAATAALAALDAMPPLEGRAEVGKRLAEHWREHVRALVERVADAVSPRAAERPAVALRELATEATGARDAFVETLGDWPELEVALERRPPSLPLPEAEPPSTLDIVAAAMGGEHRARVRIREEGAKWMTEGLLVLADWVADAPGIDAARAERAADRAVLLSAVEQ